MAKTRVHRYAICFEVRVTLKFLIICGKKSTCLNFLESPKRNKNIIQKIKTKAACCLMLTPASVVRYLFSISYTFFFLPIFYRCFGSLKPSADYTRSITNKMYKIYIYTFCGRWYAIVIIVCTVSSRRVIVSDDCVSYLYYTVTGKIDFCRR